MKNEVILSKYELISINEFYINHYIKHHLNDMVLIIETSDGFGIGENIYVTCGTCQERKDVTDYTSW
jgi:hypothetical protein